MTILIRPFEASDHDAAIALWRATPGVGLSAADERAPIERYLRRNPGMSFVAVEDGELVGTILGGHDGRRGLIHHLVAAPRVRRQGLARALVMATLGALRSEGIEKCHLLVIHDNDRGIAFWQAVGAQVRTELELLSIATDPKS